MRKILVLDDDIDLCALIQAYLGKNFQVFIANDAESALKIILNDKPDLMLLDVLMPEISGYAFRKILNDSAAKIGRTPVIVMSARESMKNFFSTADIFDFLPKPFTREQLLAVVNEYFKGKAITDNASHQAHAPKIQKSAAAAAGVIKPGQKIKETGKLKVVIASVDEDVIKILKKFFDGKNYEVEVGLDEEDVIKQSIRLKPEIIICQIWEDPNILDVAKIFHDLKANPVTQHMPFMAISIPALSLEASKLIDKDKIITFETMGELRAKIEAVL